MKTTTKLRADMILGGIMLGCAAAQQPYDYINVIQLVFGLLWVFASWISLDDHLSS